MHTAMRDFTLTHSTLRTVDSPVVFIVSDDPQVRSVLREAIVSAGWRTEGVAQTCDFLAPTEMTGPGCLIVDIDRFGGAGTALQEFMRQRRDLPVIFIADNPSVRMTVHAIKAGAVEFLTTPLDEELLLNAVEQALDLSRSVRAKQAAARVLHDRFGRLSRREREVMQLVVTGRMNKHVAEALSISEITVKAHRGQVMRKMRATSLAELVTMAATLRAAGVVSDGIPCEPELRHVRAAWPGTCEASTSLE
ncbi:MAG TPA: LuxR C-terminal-related transcriptional regulator [Povalibacter sp.]|uniref:response regulator transcription factor n=1 Tax=Povalibacter sp. TaxID=1962978 RepID=UPI002C28BE8A|nr:LuxR C-terminal-related transcriptional regulator [Povalibacter sp.]HMN47133.1 LuxR C-terminal-related transcriptional regulator [Povalibacter sp.]